MAMETSNVCEHQAEVPEDGKGGRKMYDWDYAEEYLREMKQAYEDIGWVGGFGLSNTIIPLLDRFENGERTADLYEQIMDIR